MTSDRSVCERELSMWRHLGGVTVGWLLFVVIAATTGLDIFGETLFRYSLFGLLGLWVIGGPLIYFIYVHPHTRNRSQEYET